MPLDSDIQAVLQYPIEEESSRVKCRGYVGLPITQPVYFFVMPTEADRVSKSIQLGEEIAQALPQRPALLRKFAHHAEANIHP